MLTSDQQGTHRVTEADPEVKGHGQVLLAHQAGALDDLMNRYSSWNRLKRIVAWVLRLKRNLLMCVRGDVGRSVANGNILGVDELEAAEVAIIKYVQHQSFSETCQVLQATG